jgi:hypothetical protein
LESFTDEEFLRKFFYNLGFNHQDIEMQIGNYIHFKEKDQQKQFEEFIFEAKMMVEGKYDESKDQELQLFTKNQERREIYSKYANNKKKLDLRILLDELEFNTVQEFMIWLTGQSDFPIYPIQGREIRFDMQGIKHKISNDLYQFIEKCCKSLNF